MQKKCHDTNQIFGIMALFLDAKRDVRYLLNMRWWKNHKIIIANMRGS